MWVFRTAWGDSTQGEEGRDPACLSRQDERRGQVILPKILGNMVIGVLLASAFGTIMCDEQWASLSYKIGFGFTAGMGSPFFLPNYAAFHHMGVTAALLISGFTGLLFYAPFLVHWWIKSDQ
tara:strand:+ start:363 stop:728 length:366 start_codon:yes stop_codon:yes gene_type:complete